MMEGGWEGWGVDWDGRVDVAPPRCQASLHRAVSRRRPTAMPWHGEPPHSRGLEAGGGRGSFNY